MKEIVYYLDWVAWLGGLWAAWMFTRVTLQRFVENAAERFADVKVVYEGRKQMTQHAARATYEAEAAARSSVDFDDQGGEPDMPPGMDHMDPGMPGMSQAPPQAQPGQRVVFRRRKEPPMPQPDAMEPEVREKLANRPGPISVEGASGAPTSAEKKAAG